jgi:hypothetical protein
MKVVMPANRGISLPPSGWGFPAVGVALVVGVVLGIVMAERYRVGNMTH